MYREGKWAREILSRQEADGKWGNFHSLAATCGKSMTTEQALRRLERLGFTMEDECIRKAVSYMDNCLTGKDEIPDYKEKFHDWGIFTSLMLSAWIRHFTLENEHANAVAEKWSAVVSAGFSGEAFNRKLYEEAYREILRPTHGTLLGFGNFYHVSLLSGCLDEITERQFFDSIMTGGIYYIYEKTLTELPKNFESRESSRYLAALELLAGYRCAKEKLEFAVQWMESNRDKTGMWDLGRNSGDRIYLPLSDSWRKVETRKADCTRRIECLLSRLRD